MPDERSDLRWTAERPTEPGWYWVRNRESGCVGMMLVADIGGGYLTVDAFGPGVRFWGGIGMLDRGNYEFAGPIRPPGDGQEREWDTALLEGPDDGYEVTVSRGRPTVEILDKGCPPSVYVRTEEIRDGKRVYRYRPPGSGSNESIPPGVGEP